MPARFSRLGMLALAIAAPSLAGPAQVHPAAKAFNVGTARLFSLRDALNVVPNDGSVFGVGVPPKSVADVLTKAHAPTNNITLGVDALLVEIAGRVVLLDTGLGPKVGGVLPRSLAAAGVKPQQVTDVLITHSHPDHTGGLLTADGKLAFANAFIRMSAPEWAYLQKSGDTAIVRAIRSKVRIFEPGASVLPGIRSVVLPGHTPGHSGYEITSGNERLLDIGDTAHSSIVSLTKPEWIIKYDGDPAEGRGTRERELARLAASHQRVFAPHFPFPGVGYILKAGGEYAWKPAF